MKAIIKHKRVMDPECLLKVLG
ncbi:glycosyl transferase, partial [Vibrio anguillarum]|nr:glycosyl transferase [Vibrio anguillarum]